MTFNDYKNCCLCPRNCHIDRRNSSKGFCGETDQLRVGYMGPHFGEEPPISGKNGSGTVFLSGCSLKCSFCQNQQISHEGLGSPIETETLYLKLKEMIETHQVHNINFVTPDHFFPHIFQTISLLRKNGFDLPMVFNTSGYQSREMLKQANDFADIYLPDFKYADPDLAHRLSKCRDYPEIALDGLTEMITQKGFLDACSTGNEISQKGVLVRHLILPGHLENSINALTTLFLEFGSRLPLSLMSQYYPVSHHEDDALNQVLSHEAFDPVYNHALDLGFENMFVQFPEETDGHPTKTSPFLPDFIKPEPFK